MKRTLFFLWVVLTVQFVNAQSVGIGTATPNASAQLDVTSTTKGMLIPRMTGAQRIAIASPAIGLLVIQTNSEVVPPSSPGLYLNELSGAGTAWKRIARSDEITSGTSTWTLSGSDQYSNVSGNVGIGIGAPTSKFHLVGNLLQESGTLTINNNFPTLQFQTGGVNKGFLQASGDNVFIGTSPGNTAGKFIVRLNGINQLVVEPNGNVGIGTATPNAAALVDMSSTTKGLLIPRMTGAQRNAIASPVAGLMVYQTNTEVLFPFSVLGFYVHNGTGWKLMARDEHLSWTISGNNQYSSVSGNVGIGISNPSAKLHVDGGIRAAGNLLLDDGFVYMTNTTDNHNWIMQYSNANSGMGFLDQGVERLTLKNGGNVGINNPDPLTKLHIEGGQDAGLTSTNNGYLMLGTNTTSSNLIIDNNEIIVRTGFATAGTLSLQNNGGEVAIGARTTINKDGEALKIDGANPFIQLYQSGTPRSYLQQTGNNLKIGVNGGNLILDGINNGVGTNSPNSKFHVAGRTYMNNGNGEALAIDGTNPYIQFYQSSSPKSYIQQIGTTLKMGVNGGRLNLDATQIAIGGILAAADGYLVSVTGKIICEELKVQLKEAWPDYVFSDAYKLMPLGELRQFISANNHLPNIPAATELEKNGMEVGDMQRRMMEKIEVLTLYILQLEEKINKLEKK